MYIQCTRVLNTAPLEHPQLQDRADVIVRFLEVGKQALPYGELNDWYWFRFEFEHQHKHDDALREYFAKLQQAWEAEDPKRKGRKEMLDTTASHAKKMLAVLDFQLVEKYFAKAEENEIKKNNKRGNLQLDDDMEDDEEDAAKQDPDVFSTNLVIQRCEAAITKLGTPVIGYDEDIGEHVAKHCKDPAADPLHFFDVNTILLTRVYLLTHTVIALSPSPLSATAIIFLKQCRPPLVTVKKSGSCT